MDTTDTTTTSYFGIVEAMEARKDKMRCALVVCGTTDDDNIMAVGGTPAQALGMLRIAAARIAEDYGMPLHGVLMSIVDEGVRQEVTAISQGLQIEGPGDKAKEEGHE